MVSGMAISPGTIIAALTGVRIDTSRKHRHHNVTQAVRVESVERCVRLCLTRID